MNARRSDSELPTLKRCVIEQHPPERATHHLIVRIPWSMAEAHSLCRERRLARLEQRLRECDQAVYRRS